MFNLQTEDTYETAVNEMTNRLRARRTQTDYDRSDLVQTTLDEYQSNFPGVEIGARYPREQLENHLTDVARIEEDYEQQEHPMPFIGSMSTAIGGTIGSAIAAYEIAEVHGPMAGVGAFGLLESGAISTAIGVYATHYYNKVEKRVSQLTETTSNLVREEVQSDLAETVNEDLDELTETESTLSLDDELTRETATSNNGQRNRVRS